MWSSNIRKTHWSYRNKNVTFIADYWKGMDHRETFSGHGKIFITAIMVPI